MAGPLTPEMLNATHACGRVSNYLSVGQINPRDYPLLEQAHARTHQAALARASTAEARGTLRASSMRVIMTTGDGLTTAKAVAATRGIDEVHGEVKPADKLEGRILRGSP